MNKHVLGLALISALGLAGCGGGDNTKAPTESPAPGSVPLTKAVFETADSDGDGYTIPLPNDLVFAGSTDLTLNISGVTDADISFTGDGTRRGQAQLSKLDGWSPTAPFIVKFANSSNVNLDSATFAAGIRIFKVTLNRPGAVDPAAPVSASNPKVPTGPVTAVESELVQGSDFKATMAPEVFNADGSTQPTVRIYPLKPLSPQASYMVVISNALKDSKGNGIVPDSTYGVVKQGPDAQTSATARAIAGLVATQEAAAESRGIAKRDISLSWVFTVQSVNETLSSVWAFTNGVFPGVPNPLPYVASFAGAVPLPTSIFNASNPFFTGKALLKQGSLMLPYYLTASANTSTTVPVMTGPGSIGIPGTPVYTVDAGLSTDMASISNFWKAPAKIPDGAGGVRDNPLGTNLTYANPLPSPLNADGSPRLETIPLLSATPTDPLCVKPANGWKTVIFQHGITRNRTDMLPIAETLAKPVVVDGAVIGGCFATVAIDLPTHGLASPSGLTPGSSSWALSSLFFTGFSTTDSNTTLRERTFGLDRQNNTTGALLVPDGQADSSGSWFINLAIPLNSRDNLREASTDLFGLVKALSTNTDYDIANNLYFVSQSLGSIVGSTFVAYERRVKAAVLSVPGGGIAKLLDGSTSFGPRIRAGLAGGGVVAGTPGYETFLWLAQTLVDAGDPINTAAVSAARVPALPLLVHEVVGNRDMAFPPDLVVPNSTIAGPFPYPFPATDANYDIYSDGPLAGTEPLAAALGLTAVTATTTNPAGVRGVTRFTAGVHFSLLDPSFSFSADPSIGVAVTSEMQRQAVLFLSSAGQQAVVVDNRFIVH